MMNKNKMTTKNITWKLKDLPSARELADLVSNEILTRDEAREILLGNSENDKDKIEALEKHIEFLQGLLKDALNNRTTTFVPYTQTVYLDNRVRPYWDKYWVSTNKILAGTGFTATSKTSGSLGLNVSTFNAGGLQGAVGTASSSSYKSNGEMLTMKVEANSNSN